METKDLREITEEATKKVAEQISKWTKSSVDIISSKVEEAKIDDLDKVSFSYIKPVIIYSSLKGKKVGGISLTFLEKKEAIFLANVLTGKKLNILDEEGQSSIRETSNVVSGTYANVIAKKVNETISSTQPLIVNLDDIEDVKKDLMKVEKYSSLLLFRSKFKIQKQNINIGLFIFFNKSLIKEGT